ncbi:potassium channel family protein [Desulfobaculum xiamenense]|nr:potassium channel protein [Desulfobaculum xiamenense]
MFSQVRVSNLRRRYGSFFPLLMGTVTLFLIFFGGVYAYMEIEGWNYLDSFFMVLIALSTVGFEEVHPLSEKGMILTSILILLGVGNFAFLVGSFTQILVEGRLQTVWGRLRVQKAIDGLSNHIIVCGYGRIGSIAVREILREGIPVVSIEKAPDLLAKMEEDDVLYISGDATDDEVLDRAGISRAKALITALSQEADNVYVALTARQINPDLYIVARADHETHISRLERAGADRVMLPHTLGGVRMAQSVLRPTVTSFLELTLSKHELDLNMEELEITERSEFKGKNLIESKLRQRFNIIVISIKKADGKMIFNPSAQTVLEEGDTIVIVGNKENLRELWEII